MAKKRIGRRTVRISRVSEPPNVSGTPLMPDASRPLSFNMDNQERELARQKANMEAAGDSFFRVTGRKGRRR